MGINVIFYYLFMLWYLVGFSEVDLFIIIVVILVVNVLVILVVIVLVDKIGCKLLLVVGLVGMVLILGVMVWCFL